MLQILNCIIIIQEKIEIFMHNFTIDKKVYNECFKTTSYEFFGKWKKTSH